MTKSEFQKIENYMRECMPDSAHDCEHVYRVLYVALDIADHEQDVDMDVLIAAALLHDIGRREQFENPKVCHAQVGAEKARKYLLENGYDAEFAGKVESCIRAHRYRSSNPPQTIEEKILFDADKIDVTGTLGVARTLLYKGKVGEPLYSLNADGLVSDGSNDTEPSFFQEYKYKLEGLYAKFLTTRGWEIALERRHSAVMFYESMLAEVQDSYEKGQTLLADLYDGAERAEPTETKQDVVQMLDKMEQGIDKLVEKVEEHIIPILEKMGNFFDARLNGYEEHQLTCIESAQEFYPFTAEQLPMEAGAKILDLGCGTGLELNYYFEKNPTAKVTGIDLAPGMLTALQEKFTDKDLTLIQGSYFEVPLGEEVYDAAVSVESLHHFTKEEKLPLYRKLYQALKSGGYFILTDYFAPTEELEREYRANLLYLKKEQGIVDDELYHYDTPLTVEHEIEALQEAGFECVEVLGSWGASSTLRAGKASE